MQLSKTLVNQLSCREHTFLKPVPFLNISANQVYGNIPSKSALKKKKKYRVYSILSIGSKSDRTAE